MFPKQVGNGTGVTRLEQLPFILEYKPVRIRVNREDRRFTKHMGRKQRTEAVDPLVDKGFGILSLVCGNQLESFSDERKAEIPRRKTEAAEAGRAEESEDEIGGDEEEKGEKEGSH